MTKYHMLASIVLPDSRKRSPRTLYNLPADAEELLALGLFLEEGWSNVELRVGIVPGPRVDDRLNINAEESLVWDAPVRSECVCWVGNIGCDVVLVSVMSDVGSLKPGNSPKRLAFKASFPIGVSSI